MVIINQMTNANKADLHKSNQPFDIIGRLDVRFENGRWTSTEVLARKVTSKQYPDYDGAIADDYIAASDRVAYLAYDNGECIGQVLVAVTWNKYAHVEDISVARDYRGRGVGTLLLSAAEGWARNMGLAALSLESQDNNILASRFFAQNGFNIGGANTELYALLGEPYSSETAVFWYKNILCNH